MSINLKMKKMKKLYFIIVLALIIGLATSLESCRKKKNEDNDPVPAPTPTPTTTTVEVSGEITSATTWKADTKYILKGFVYVVDGITLTIEAGTIIKGDKTTMGTLIIEKGAKINATGTSDKPVVFTSNGPVGYRGRGDWGGIILCGKAPINNGDAQIEGGPRSHYGGADASDNSGILKYVRIEYAGYPFQPDKEVNGLTLGGVGSGTTIDYIQVSYANDDSFEWFGGNVNCKHLVAYKGLDDDFDSDYGYSGKLQFLVALRDRTVADVSGSNGFESDNDAGGSDNAPLTHPVFCNVSIFGPYETTSTSNVSSNFKSSLHIRRNSRLCCYNSVIAGYYSGILIDGSKCENATSDATTKLELKNVTIAGCKSSYFSVASSGATWTSSDVKSWFIAGNDTVTATSSLKIGGPWAATPNFMPQSDSPLLNSADFSSANLQSFFDVVTFRGAFGTDNWMNGWTNFDPQNATY